MAAPVARGDQAAAFLIAAGLLGFLAFDNGGYDLVVRQEVALGVWIAIALGFAFGVLPRARCGRLGLLALALGTGYLAWMAFSLGWTGSDERTVAEICRALGYLGIVTLALTALERHTFRAAAAGLSVAAVVVISFGVASRLIPSAFPEATEVARLFRADRLDYPLDYWNAVAAWGAMSIAITIGWSSHARSWLIRAASLAAAPVASLGVYLTYSRGGVIAAAIALVAVLVLSHNRWTALIHALAAAAGTAAAIFVVRSQPEIADATGGAGGGIVLLTLLVAGAACAGVAVLTATARTDDLRLPPATAARATPALILVLLAAAIAFAGSPISRAWDQFRNEDQVASGPDPASRLTTAGGKRNELWSSALAAFDAHPAGGIGPGTYEWWWSRDARDEEFVRDAHSIYLEHLAELGLPGLLLLLASFGALLAMALRPRMVQTPPADLAASVAMISAFVVFLFSSGVDWMWEETAVAALGLGAVAVAASAGSRPIPRAARREPIAAPGVRAAIVAAAILAAAVEVPGIVSTQRIRDSEAAARAGDLEESGELAQEAVDAAPWSATPHQQLALVREAQRRLPEAEREIGEAIAKEPDNWEHPLVLARIELKEGRIAAARRTFEAGRRLRPFAPSYWPSSWLGRRLDGPQAPERTARPPQAAPNISDPEAGRSSSPSYRLDHSDRNPARR